MPHAQHLGDERGGTGAVAHLPPGGVVGLAERADHQRPVGDVGMAGQTLVPGAVEPHVLVDLVRDHHGVGVRQHVGQRAHVVEAPHHAGGIVRRVEDDDARLRRHDAAHLVPVDLVVRIAQRHVARHAAAQLHGGQVGVVGGLEQHHFVAGTNQCGQRREQRLGGAGGNRDLRHRVVAPPVQVLDLHRQCFPQRGHAGHLRVLVVALAHVVRHRVHELGRAAEVGEPLRQVHGLVLPRQARHHLEDADAARRQLGQDGLPPFDSTQASATTTRGSTPADTAGAAR